jgi:hypothetical protein
MPPKWRARMLLLKVRLLQHRGLVREALELLDNVKEEIPEAAIAERVEMAVLEADLLILSDAQGEALEALRRAVTLSFMYPQKVKVDQRLLLGYRLGRMLYEEKNYAAAADWFAKLTLLAPVTEIAELLYWQLRCQIGLSESEPIDELLLRLQQEYPEKVFILSPFDNLIINRQRILDVFDFDFKLECYLPAAKRKYGFFSMPLLYQDRFIGLLDAKAERKNKVLLINNLIKFTKLSKKEEKLLQSAIEDFAVFNNCQTIDFNPRS